MSKLPYQTHIPKCPNEWKNIDIIYLKSTVNYAEQSLTDKPKKTDNDIENVIKIG